MPVVSVDTKKKELVGDTPGYANKGKDWQPEGKPVEVGVHDFPDPSIGKAVPYGVYDIGANNGWVLVGSDGDTAAFAVQALRRWWTTMGSTAYPDAKQIMITADAGGLTVTEQGSGKPSFQNLLPKPVSQSRFVISRPEPRNGTKSNIASSPTSQ